DAAKSFAHDGLAGRLSRLNGEDRIDTRALALRPGSDAQGLDPARSGRFLKSLDRSELLVHLDTRKPFSGNGLRQTLQGGRRLHAGKALCRAIAHGCYQRNAIGFEIL